MNLGPESVQWAISQFTHLVGKKMPKRTNDFQTLIKTIYEQIVPEGGSVTESGMVRDKEAGILREVDILVSYKYAGHEFSFIVECRDRSRSESVEWIDALIGKTKSLNVNKVIAVSSKGFASSAERKAKENGIETLTLEAANDKDWSNFPIKPGITVMTDDIYQINDVFYKDGDEYLQATILGLENDVEVNGEVVGNLREVIEYFFHKYLVPKIDEYKKSNFPALFKTREDVEKTLIAQYECDWPGIHVINDDGVRIKLKKVKYIVTGNRKTMDVEQEHYVFNQRTVSIGKHFDSDGSVINFNVIQDPDTKKLHISWKRTDGNESSAS